MTGPCFALLDDCGRDARSPSRLYTGLRHEHRCTDPARLEACWAGVEADLRDGGHAVLLADYEFGATLHGIVPRASDASALRVLVFDELQRLDAVAVEAWLAMRDGRESPGPAGAFDLRPDEDEAAFTAAIAAIQDAIRAGRSYQVNHTFRLHGRAFGDPLALYRRLRARQPVRYGALIALPPGDGGPEYVLSCSPELFLQHDGGRLLARPMKGTAARGVDAADDELIAQTLRADPKNRAENLMIVDLLRNDLGRVATVGSVRVPALFEVEAHAGVLQMTSSVEAELAPDVAMPALLRAAFPCGSITGAPKRETMRLIRELESSPRGLYTGAIGWVEPPTTGAAVGDFCLSVAIRTLILDAAAADGTRALTLGVGAGIVLDSRADDEWQECRLKARFLTGLDPGFTLFETMRATREGGIDRRGAHRQRLLVSAATLGFAADEAAIDAALDAAVAALHEHTASRLKLVLHHDGRIETLAAPLMPITEPVRLRVAPLPVSVDALFAHKTSRRAFYDEAVALAEAAGCFDTLCHVGGKLVEGARSSVFVQLDGAWFTPPLAAGALLGVMRAELMNKWKAVERTLSLDDLARAERVVVCNSLRGALDAVLAG